MLLSSSLTSHSQPKLAEPISLIQRLINQSTEAIFCIDARAYFCYVNDAACSLVGYPRQKLLEMNINEIILDFLPSTWSHYWQLIRQKASLNFKVPRFSQPDRSLEVTINFLEHEAKTFGCILVRPIYTNILEIPSERESFRTKENNSLPISSFYPTSTQLKPIFEFIEENYRRPIKLDCIAQAVGYSPAYLTNLVKRKTKKTIINWILERRMLEARSLLITTNRSITEIAMDVGFIDAYYFSRRFSQYHKMSPRSWRQKHQLQSA